MSDLKTIHVRRFLIALTAAVALCLAAGSVSHAAAGSSATVKTRHGKLGTFLVDSKGRTHGAIAAQHVHASFRADPCVTG